MSPVLKAVWVLIGGGVIAAAGGSIIEPPLNFFVALVFLAEAAFLLAVDRFLGPPSD